MRYMLGTNILIYFIKNRPPGIAERMESLARQVPVSYPVDRSICHHYAAQFTRLKPAGTPIPRPPVVARPDPIASIA